jgi:hypothetical protein
LKPVGFRRTSDTVGSDAFTALHLWEDHPVEDPEPMRGSEQAMADYLDANGHSYEYERPLGTRAPDFTMRTAHGARRHHL